MKPRSQCEGQRYALLPTTAFKYVLQKAATSKPGLPLSSLRWGGILVPAVSHRVGQKMSF